MDFLNSIDILIKLLIYYIMYSFFPCINYHNFHSFLEKYYNNYSKVFEWERLCKY